MDGKRAAAGDPGLFGPDTLVWQIARERALLLGGPAALLLQLAHPLVAAGVAEHSDFRRDPLRRLVGTMETTLTITFGDRHEAAAAADAVRRVHARVAGALPAAQGAWAAGTPYRATDARLALWVFATLIETALNTYQLFVAPLDAPQRARYYDESAPFAAAFGVHPPVLPATYREFCDYYHDMVDQQLTVGSLAREQARAVLHARLRGVPIAAPATWLASLLLPTRIREAYHLPLVPRLTAWPMRQAVRRLPDRAKYWPGYAQAMRRVTTSAGGSSTRP